MKFILPKSTLEKAMAQIDAIVPGRDTQTLLSNVLIGIEKEKVRITASDMESTVRISIDAEDTETGELIVRAKKLSEIARQINSEKVVFSSEVDEEAEGADEGAVYRVRLEGSGKMAAKFRMAGSDRSHFPEMTEIGADKLSKIPSDILSEMIAKTVYSISQEDNRYIYNGLYFQADGNKLTIVGTDGRRLAAVSRTVPEPISIGSAEAGDIVVHAKAIRELVKIMESGEDVSIGVEQRDVFFQVDQAELSSRLLEGKFPDYKKVIPGTSEIDFEINREDLSDAIRQIMVMTEQPSYQVRLSLSSAGVELSANTPDVGAAEITLPVQGLDQELVIGFNANYLMDILKNLDCEMVRLKFIDPAKPIVVEDTGDDQFVSLVMPMKI